MSALWPSAWAFFHLAGKTQKHSIRFVFRYIENQNKCKVQSEATAFRRKDCLYPRYALYMVR